MQFIDQLSRVIFRSFYLTADKITALVYKVSNGTVGHKQAQFRILMLSSIGRKTSMVRTHALLYTPVNEDWIVIASNGGDKNHPAWYLNLIANPEAQIQVGKKRYKVIAQVSHGKEREILWQKLLIIWPLYASYQEKTDRQFPIIKLRRMDGN